MFQFPSTTPLWGPKILAFGAAFLFPFYGTLKCLHKCKNSGDRHQLHFWIKYWILYGSFVRVLRSISVLLEQWIPRVVVLECLVILWLYLPVCKGAETIYAILRREIMDIKRLSRVFRSNDINHWGVFFKLEDLVSYLVSDVGVSTVDDLRDLCRDKTLINDLRNHCGAEVFYSFVKACRVSSRVEDVPINLSDAQRTEILNFEIAELSADLQELQRNGITASPSSLPDVEPSELHHCVVSELEPEWEGVKEETIHQYAMVAPPSFIGLLQMENWAWSSVTTVPELKRIKISKHAFSTGRSGLRATRKALEYNEKGQVLRTCVHKEFLSKNHEDLSQEAYVQRIAAHRTAWYLAQEFNKVVGTAHNTPKIEFTEASVCQLLTVKGRPFFLLETSLESAGSWEHFNSCDGVVATNPSPTSGVDHAIVQAFSHWTHAVTKGCLMVVDCQGVFDEDRKTFRLSDPVVHCASAPERYSPANGGAAGMQSFLSSHTCNEWCVKVLRSTSSPGASSGLIKSIFG